MNRMELYLKEILPDHVLEKQKGQFLDFTEDWTLLKDNSITETCIYDTTTNKMIAYLKRNAILPEICELAVQHFLPIAKKHDSTNRGMAAGTIHRDIINDKFEKSASVHSVILGYFDSTNGKLPCRLTKYSKDYLNQYHKGIPFIQAMNTCFQSLCPEAYQRQYMAASNSGFNIQDTAFSTLTVNYNFRTALHVDKGDFKEGFGNLVVCSKDLEGGYLLFPKYQLGIQLYTGDYLAMDVHQYHCNSPIQTNIDGYRLSFVGYFRSSLSKCQEKNERYENQDLHDTDAIITEMFKKIQEPVPIKEAIGIGSKGEIWWKRTAGRFTLTYKGRQYTLQDRISDTETKKIHSLYPAYLYVKNLSL